MLVLDNGVEREATPEELAEIEARSAVPVAPYVPQIVTNGQAREALLNAGLYDQVEPAIASIEDADIRQRAEIAWQYRPSVERNSPFVAMIAQALNMDDAALDGLFIEAAQL